LTAADIAAPVAALWQRAVLTSGKRGMLRTNSKKLAVRQGFEPWVGL
jgi:hypothetical protein